MRKISKIADKRYTLEAIREGVCIHTRTVHSVLGEDGAIDEAHTLAKGLNFGLLYGTGTRKLRDKIEETQWCPPGSLKLYRGDICGFVATRSGRWTRTDGQLPTLARVCESPPGYPLRRSVRHL